MLKKLCALTVAFAMVASLLAVGAFAAESELVRSEYSYLKSSEAFNASTPVAAGDEITAKVSVGNAAATAQEAVLITALYNSANKLVAVDSASKTLAQGEYDELQAVVTAPSNDANATYSIKSYVWDGLDSMIPCTDIDTAAPAAPANLTAGDVTTSTIALSWTEVTDTDAANVLGYNIYRGTEKIATTTATSYTDTRLNDNVAYTYTVKAFNVVGESAASNEVSATTENIATVNMSDLPTEWRTSGLQSSAYVGTDGLDVYSKVGSPNFVANFDESKAAASDYSIFEYGTEENRKEICYASYEMTSSNYGMIFRIPSTSILRTQSNNVTIIFRYFDNGTAPIQVRYKTTTGNVDVDAVTRTNSNAWKTCEYNAGNIQFGSGNMQIWFAPNTDNGAIYISEVGVARNYVSALIDTPDNLAVTGTTTSTVTLSWTASQTEEISGYNVYRAGAKVGSTTELTYTDVNLDDDTDYSYRITAYDESGNESDITAAVVATTTDIATVKMSDLSSYSTASEGPTTAQATSGGLYVRKAGGTWVANFDEATAADDSCGIVEYGTQESGKEWCYASKNMSDSKYGILIDIGSTPIFKNQENNVTLIVRYFDNGNAIKIRHRGNANTPVTLVAAHTGTNTWKTVEYNMGNVKFIDNKAVQFTTGTDDGAIYISEVSLAINYVPKTAN